MHHLSDEQLITAYLKGNEKALEILIGRYLKLVYSVARKYTGNPDNAADIAQETFVKAWRNFKKFDTAKKFKPWILTIAKNTALDWLKKKAELPFSSLERKDGNIPFAETIEDSGANIIDLLHLKELGADIELALKKLPSGYSTIISLRHSKQMTFKEIAEFLQRPLNTVKSSYRRGIKMLKEQL